MRGAPREQAVQRMNTALAALHGVQALSEQADAFSFGVLTPDPNGPARSVAQLLSDVDEKLYETRVIQSWSAVLGDNIMRYTTAIYFNKKKLFVTLSSSVLRHELFLTRDEIKNSLNKYVGADVVKEIVFQ